MVTAPSFRAVGTRVDVASMQSSVFDVPLPVEAVAGDVALLLVQGAVNTSTSSWTRVVRNGSGVHGLDVFAAKLTASDVSAGKATVTVGAGAAASPGSAVIACWSDSDGIELSDSGGSTTTSWKALATSNPALVVYAAALGSNCTAFTATGPTERFKRVENPGRLMYVGDAASTSTSPAGSFSVTAGGNTPSRVQVVLSGLTPPDAPTLVAPAPDAVAAVGPVQVSWLHAPGGSFGEQSEWSLRLTDSDETVWYYDATVDDLVDDETWNAGVANLASPTLTRDAWSWAVATKPTNGARSDYSTDRALQTVDAPTVDVTAPSGTVSDPAAAWTTTVDAAVGAYGQTGWIARYWSAAQVALPGWDSDTTPLVEGSGTSETTFDPGLLSPGSYRVGVSVRETGNVWSAWELVDFTVDSAVSGSLDAPTLTAGQGGLPSGAPAVELVLSGVDGAVQVDYSDDGVTWTRAVLELDADGSAFDATAPLDVERSYRARVTDGVHVSAWSATVSHALWSAGAVLVDLVTGYAVPAWVTSEDTRANPVERDVLHAIGRPTAIISSDVLGADTGGLTVLTDTQARMRDVLAALASGLVMIRWQPEQDADGPGVRPGDDVVQVTSDVTRERVVQKALAYRQVSFSWATQPSPAAVLWAA